MLYLVSTPIGNLKDITYRAVEQLTNCDYILCEDTRHSLKLLNALSINKKLVSFHKFNEKEKEDRIIEDLKSGKNICLISDAGTPGISDPGEMLIKRCIQEQIDVFACPGPCSLIYALILSGLSLDKFQFVGFLPKDRNPLNAALKEYLAYDGVTIAFESPERILKVLKLLSEIVPNRSIVIARELTKKFEEFLRGSPIELLKILEEKTIKGEIVLLIDKDHEPKINEDIHLSIEDHVNKIIQEEDISLNDAIKQVAKIRNVSKRDIYNVIHKKP